MVAVEGADVAGVSIGNRRSALDAKGGCCSLRTTPSPYIALACQRCSWTGGVEAVGETVERGAEPTEPGPVGARSLPMSLSWQVSHSHHSWIGAGSRAGSGAKNCRQHPPVSQGIRLR